MSNLEHLSDEELMKEIKKRKLDEKNKKMQKALLIDDEIEKLIPKPLDNPNVEPLAKLCVEYITETIKNGYTNEDYPQWFEETALITLMGRDVYDKLRKINNLKQEKKDILK